MKKTIISKTNFYRSWVPKHGCWKTIEKNFWILWLYLLLSSQMKLTIGCSHLTLTSNFIQTNGCALRKGEGADSGWDSFVGGNLMCWYRGPWHRLKRQKKKLLQLWRKQYLFGNCFWNKHKGTSCYKSALGFHIILKIDNLFNTNDFSKCKRDKFWRISHEKLTVGDGG